MNWVDLVLIGFDVAQSHQLHKAREQLNRLEAGAVLSMLHNEMLISLRSFIFECAKEIEVLEQNLDSSSLSVYVAAKTFEWRLHDMGISPEIFPEFADKEYVQRLHNKLTRIIQELRRKLTAGQINQAEDCFSFIVHMPLLDQAIIGQEAREQLQASDVEWKALSSKKSFFNLAGLGSLIGGFIFPLLMIAILSYIPIPEVLRENLSCSVCIFGFGLILGGILLMAMSSSSQYWQLAKDRQEWKGKIPNNQTWNTIVNLFGQRSGEEYRRLRTTREGIIRQMMGQINNNYHQLN